MLRHARRVRKQAQQQAEKVWLLTGLLAAETALWLVWLLRGLGY